MKCVCICCFDHYATRMRSVIDYFNSKGYETTYIISDYQHYGKYRFIASYEDTLQIHVPGYKRNISLNRILSHLIFSRNVYKELKKIKPDVIFCNFPPNSLVRIVTKYKQISSCKVIFDCYDMWPESFPYTKFNRFLKLPFEVWKNLRDKNINNSDMVVCVSEDGKEALKNKGISTQISVIKPVIVADNLTVYSAVQSNKISICYLGHINHITDVELGIALLSQIEKYKHVVFHHIGKGENCNDLYYGLKKIGVEIVSHGVVFDQEKKSSIYSLCQFGLSIPKEEIHSTMALKSLEYMMVGLPIINAGVGDIYDIIEKANLGINIQRNDLEQSAKMIISKTADELNKYHKNCISYYNNIICKQNFDDIFGKISV